MTTIGYARVSTRDQNPGSQEHKLREAGAERVFVDRGESSRAEDRPQWLACLDYLRRGDTLLILALDRVAGTEKIAIETIRELGGRGIRLRSLSEPFLDVDTSTPMGEAIVGIMAVLAQLRVATIRDNTRRGVAYARDVKGKTLGRPRALDIEQTEAAVRMREHNTSIAAIARTLGKAESSVRRALARYEELRDEEAAVTAFAGSELARRSDQST